jgi:hypothetical protein
MWRPQVDGLAGIADCTIADRGKADSIAAMADAALAAAPQGSFALASFSMSAHTCPRWASLPRSPPRCRPG